MLGTIFLCSLCFELPSGQFIYRYHFVFLMYFKRGDFGVEWKTFHFFNDVFVKVFTDLIYLIL